MLAGKPSTCAEMPERPWTKITMTTLFETIKYKKCGYVLDLTYTTCAVLPWEGRAQKKMATPRQSTYEDVVQPSTHEVLVVAVQVAVATAIAASAPWPTATKAAQCGRYAPIQDYVLRMQMLVVLLRGDDPLCGIQPSIARTAIPLFPRAARSRPGSGRGIAVHC